MAITRGIKHWGLGGYLNFLPRIKFGVTGQESSSQSATFHSVPRSNERQLIFIACCNWDGGIRRLPDEPPKSFCRKGHQTTRRCCGKEPPKDRGRLWYWASKKRFRHERNQVWIKEMNASEPLMRCREVVHPVKSYEVCGGVKSSVERY